jgi:hypothetical protein
VIACSTTSASNMWRLPTPLGGYAPRPHYPYYAYLFTLFFTEIRPSEASALRVGVVDLANGVLRIERSRSLGHEGAPKTAAAARWVRLTARNVEILRLLIELNTGPEDYLFKNTLGEPIHQAHFYRLFCGAQRALGIRLRDLYATKDTYVSLALTRGSEPHLAFRADRRGGEHAAKALWAIRSHAGSRRRRTLQTRHRWCETHPRFGAVCPSVCPSGDSDRKKFNEFRKLTNGAEGSRTLDLLNAIQALSQLSYSPVPVRTFFKSER